MNVKDTDIYWIGTLGGPLILMEREALMHWKGDVAVGKESDRFEQSDYERACEVSDWLGSIEVGDRMALVLAMPNETAIFKIDSKSALIVRWIWGESDEQVQGILRDFDFNQSWIDAEANIQCESGELILFDSVIDGRAISDFLIIDVEPGLYTATTLSYQHNKETNLFLIKLDGR